MRAIIYGRVSAETQEEGRALEFQIKKCQDFCVLKEYKVYKIIQDVKSGGKDDRDGYIELQKEIELRSFDIVVVYESSRISRITRTMLDFVFKLQSNDIKIVSVSQPELDTTTHTGILFFEIQASLGAYERKQISQRVKSSKWQRAKEGNWQGGNTPLGYKNTKDGIIIIEEEAEIVRNMFEYYMSTKSLAKTSKLFKKHISSIKWILSNEFYTGKFPFGRKENNINTGKIKIYETPIEIFDGKHEAIIDEKTFIIVQKFLKIGRPCTLKGYILIFSGLIMCEHGKKMYKNSKNKNGNYFYYYRVHNCKYTLPHEELEEKIIQELLKIDKLKYLKEVLINMNDMDRKEIQELFRLLIKKIELTSINPISVNFVLNI